MPNTSSDWREILSIVDQMLHGTKFVEISTYLKNHTDLNHFQIADASQSLSQIQRKMSEINTLIEEMYNNVYYDFLHR